MSNNSYTPGTRVQYIGLDPRFIGVDGTIVLYNNQILIDWDNGYSFTIKAMDGHFKIIDREIKEDIKDSFVSKKTISATFDDLKDSDNSKKSLLDIFNNF